MKRVALPILVAITALAMITFGVIRLVRAATGTTSDVCNGSLTATTYPGGIAGASFASTTAISAVAGTGLQLNTNLTPLDPNHIVLPFDQDVKVRYVYRNAGASMTLGWFYLDAIQSYLNKPATDPTADLIVGATDISGNKLYTWFQSGGLWHVSNGQTLPDLVRSATDFKDTTSVTYPHIPHLLETLMTPGKGGMIFKLCDDDSDTSAQNSSNSGQLLTPVGDTLTAQDAYSPGNGIPDYDVNGNGITDEVADRTVDLGTIQGNREIVFFMVNYYTGANQLRYVGLGVPETATGKSGTTATLQNADIIPYFTKDILNPDRGAQPPGTVVRKTAIGCGRDDNTCYTPKGATLGWLDPNTLLRLKAAANVADYHQLDLTGDNTVRTIQVGADSSVPHFVVFAPSTEPNLWLVGFDNKPEYANGGSDFDYDDTVFLIDHSNGGSVTSNVISTIPAADLPNSVISKVRINATTSFPAGCTAVGDGSINIYYSVDNGTTWHLAGTTDRNNPTLDVTIDVLGAGYVGNQLRWKADINSAVQTCQPVIASLDEGYEAVKHGVFKFAAPIPLSNVAYTGALETPPFPATEPAITRGDYSLRGHFFSERLYDPVAPTTTSLAQEWDAGVVLAAKSPTARNIYTSVGGSTVAFTTANGASLYPLILPGTLMGASSPQVSGKYVYDYNGDNVVSNTDAQFVLEWTRGWEFPSGITFTPSQTVGQRGWKLGPVHNSSPAIVGPPPAPIWNGGSAVPAAMTTAHLAFVSANSTRSTVAVVGAQDGMLHAFDAGQFRYGNDASCNANLYRGCYAGATDAARYGTGDEKWAWVPPSQLSQLKNNHPLTRSYNSAANPQAEVDGSVSVDDIFVAGSNTFKTVAFASLGRAQPYITAVDISGTTPAALWASDFSDPGFNGTELSPSTGLTAIPTSGVAGTFALITTSGLSASLTNEYIYFINPLTGKIINPLDGTNDTTGGFTKGKIQLNAGNSNAAYNTTAYGFAGYPNLVDANQDGLIDRVYAVDTSGRVFKYDLTTRTKCVVAATGESVFSGMAVDVSGSSGAPVVRLYVGGGPNPDGTGSTTGGGPGGVFRAFAFQDNDVVGVCTAGGASTVYTKNLSAGEKVWAAPVVAGTDVFYATAATTSVGICSSANGELLSLATTGDGVNPTFTNPPQTIAGSSVSSFRIYDGHALVNTIGGATTVLGGITWNNAPASGGGSGSTGGAIATLKSLLWQEQ